MVRISMGDLRASTLKLLSISTLGLFAFLGLTAGSAHAADLTDYTNSWKYHVGSDGKAVITDCASICAKDIVIPATLKTSKTTSISVSTVGVEDGSGSHFAGVTDGSVTINTGVTKISPYAFEYNQIASVSLPTSLTDIGVNAFDLNHLTQLKIPNGVTSLPEGAFGRNRISQLNLPASLRSIGDAAFNQNSLSSVNLPAGLVSIGGGAFYGNNITSVTLPAALSDLGINAFNKLVGYKVNPANTHFSTDKTGVLFNKDQTQLVSWPGGKIVSSYAMPNTVTDLRDGAFWNGCAGGKPKFTKLTLSSSLQHIGYQALACNGLTSIDLPDGLQTIGESAFDGNPLSQIVIPGSVTEVGPAALSEMPSLDKVIIMPGVQKIGAAAFNSVGDNISSIVLPASVNSVGANAFANNVKLKDLWLAGNAPALGNEMAFQPGTNVHRLASATGFDADPLWNDSFFFHLVDWAADTVAPSLSATRTLPAVSPTTAKTAKITWTATDPGSGLLIVRCKLDGGVYSECPASPVSLSGLSKAAHTYTVQATDKQGNQSVQSVSWTVR